MEHSLFFSTHFLCYFFMLKYSKRSLTSYLSEADFASTKTTMNIVMYLQNTSNWIVSKLNNDIILEYSSLFSRRSFYNLIVFRRLGGTICNQQEYLNQERHQRIHNKTHLTIHSHHRKSPLCMYCTYQPNTSSPPWIITYNNWSNNNIYQNSPRNTFCSYSDSNHLNIS